MIRIPLKILVFLAALGAGCIGAMAADFVACGSGKRVNCVVDGDTLWLSGTKIRIEGIDAAEIGQAKCAAERIRGEAAKRRLIALVNSGPFRLERKGADEDVYGRKLRRLVRGQQSLGDVLITEGLARAWDGKRRSWCDEGARPIGR